MFAYIKGNLEIKTTGYVVIDVNGVGYKIYMAQNAIDRVRKYWRCSKSTHILSCKRRQY